MQGSLEEKAQKLTPSIGSNNQENFNYNQESSRNNQASTASPITLKTIENNSRTTQPLREQSNYEFFNYPK